MNLAKLVGAGRIVAIILACIAVIAALILTHFCFKKVNKKENVEEARESTILKLKN